MKKIIYILLIAFSLLTACHNQDWEFSDYDYNTVYFPYQSPVRTLILGEDIYDNSLDNEHKCKIMATMGGVYENEKDRILDIIVDNSLCDNLKFESEAGNNVLPMPVDYYSLPDDMQIIIPSGSISGGIEVQLNEAFFQDSLSIKDTYVIPLKIVSVTNADSILSGKSSLDNPDLRVNEDWSIVPKNYTLYCVKYVNSWHGAYLRRGVDVIKGNEGNTTLDSIITYHRQYVEEDEVVYMHTVSISEVSLSLTTRNKGNSTDIPFELRINVDDSGKCTVSNPDSISYTIIGSGEFIDDGDEWGNEKRDVMYLKYQVGFGTSTHSFFDTIVMRDRQITFESFTPVVVD